MKILANDGLSQSGIDVLEKGRFEVIATKVAQNQLENYINDNNIDGIIVRNATQVRQELIEACPSLKLIAKSGVGLENIDVEYAEDNGLHVINAPKSSANAIAELVFAHLFGMSRFLHSSNREMPLEGDSRFNDLKKAYSNGIELRGKTIGIIGFDAIGQQVAKIALGIGMHVLASDDIVKNETISLDFFNGQKVNINIETIDKETLIKDADFISLHALNEDGFVIDAKEIEKMKDGVGIVNTAKPGALNEIALINAIEEGKVQFAGLDVFEKQPTPEIQLLMNPELSLSPNIGAATLETQERMGIELANQITKLLS